MNLLLINYEYPPIGGGAGNATMFIARALHDLGHRAHVLTTAYDAPPGARDEEGVTVHRLRARRSRPDRASAFEMLSFLRVASAAAPSIAASNAIDGAIVFFTLPCGPVAAALRRKAGVPYIVSLRGGDVPGLVPEIAWQHWALTAVRRRVLRHASAIVANDPGLAALSSRADPYPVEVIPNGVDTAYYRPHVQDAQARAMTNLLFVGRFHRQKNLILLLETLARLEADAPGRWHLSLVGDGEERARLALSADRLGIAKRISWHGWQGDKNALRMLYQRSDILVNPSLYEGLPNVVLEAMACGLPVVASDIPGNNTLVRPGGTGLLFRLDDPVSLYAALRSLQEHPETARALGSEGRRTAEEDYSWTGVARKYLSLFETAGRGPGIA